MQQQQQQKSNNQSSGGFRAKIGRAQYMIGALCFICIEYYFFTFQFMRDRFAMHGFTTGLILFFFNVIVCMLLWSMFQTVRSDPGKVPLYWGVIMDEPEGMKKRRYCLICHQFKPERSHHCSNCTRCVLNMDHHCPWIMNCIGFTNRKFFILMVFYISLAAMYMSGFEILFIVELIKASESFEAIKARFSIANLFVKVVALLITLVFTIVIVNFFSFHISMLLRNSTTIETMEKKKADLAAGRTGQVANTPSPYDFGYKINWYSVFGMNPYIWFIPIFTDSGKPLGDGVTWDQVALSNRFTNQTNTSLVITSNQDQSIPNIPATTRAPSDNSYPNYAGKNNNVSQSYMSSLSQQQQQQQQQQQFQQQQQHQGNVNQITNGVASAYRSHVSTNSNPQFYPQSPNTSGIQLNPAFLQKYDQQSRYSTNN